MTGVKLSVEKEGGISIIVPSGEMLAGEGDIRLKEEFDWLQKAGNTRVILDLSEVPYFDSSVLGQLVHSHAILTKAGGGLKLASPSERISGVLSLTRLISVFDVYHSREDALASWADRKNPREEPEL